MHNVDTDSLPNFNPSWIMQCILNTSTDALWIHRLECWGNPGVCSSMRTCSVWHKSLWYQPDVPPWDAGARGLHQEGSWPWWESTSQWRGDQWPWCAVEKRSVLDTAQSIGVCIVAYATWKGCNTPPCTCSPCIFVLPCTFAARYLFSVPDKWTNDQQDDMMHMLEDRNPFAVHGFD